MDVFFGHVVVDISVVVAVIFNVPVVIAVGTINERPFLSLTSMSLFLIFLSLLLLVRLTTAFRDHSIVLSTQSHRRFTINAELRHTAVRHSCI